MTEKTKHLSDQLAASVSEAERATSQITDPELRRLAFDRVLEHLLQTSQPGVEKPPKGTKQRGAKEKAPESSKPGPKAWIRELVEEGFFDEPKTIKALQEGLEKKKHFLELTALTGPLDLLKNEKVLRRKTMKPEEGGRARVHWYKW